MAHEDMTQKHFRSSEKVRDVVIGMSDGLTVPFALAAGLTGAIAASRLIIIAGLAEIVAGSISMGLGGFLAARSDAEHYFRERTVEENEVKTIPEKEAQEIREIFTGYGLNKEHIEPIVDTFKADHDKWIDFMMVNELGLEPPQPKRALTSALTIAAAYVVGGMVPLSAYFFVSNARRAVLPSIIITLIALCLFGYIKAKVAGVNPQKSAFQTVLVGGLAAGAAFIIARLIQGK